MMSPLWWLSGEWLWFLRQTIRMCVFFILFIGNKSRGRVGESSVELNLVSLPIKLKVGEEGLLDHSYRDICRPNGEFGEFTSHNKPLDSEVVEVDDSSDFVIFFGFETDVFLFVLLTYGSIVAIITYTIHLFEAKLFVFVLVSDYPHHDIVVFDLKDPNIEEYLSFLRQRLMVEQLVCRTMELLHLVSCNFKFEVVSSSLVQTQHHLLPIFLEFPHLTHLHRSLFDRDVLLSKGRTLRVIFFASFLLLHLLNLVLHVPYPPERLLVFALLLVYDVFQPKDLFLFLNHNFVFFKEGQPERLKLQLLILDCRFELINLFLQQFLRRKFGWRQGQSKLFVLSQDVGQKHQRTILHFNPFLRIVGEKRVQFSDTLEENFEFEGKILVGIAPSILLERLLALQLDRHHFGSCVKFNSGKAQVLWRAGHPLLNYYVCGAEGANQDLSRVILIIFFKVQQYRNQISFRACPKAIKEVRIPMNPALPARPEGRFRQQQATKMSRTFLRNSIDLLRTSFSPLARSS